MGNSYKLPKPKICKACQCSKCDTKTCENNPCTFEGYCGSLTIECEQFFQDIHKHKLMKEEIREHNDAMAAQERIRKEARAKDLLMSEAEIKAELEQLRPKYSKGRRAESKLTTILAAVTQRNTAMFERIVDLEKRITKVNILDPVTSGHKSNHQPRQPKEKSETEIMIEQILASGNQTAISKLMTLITESTK
jgi:hypothetical protein